MSHSRGPSDISVGASGWRAGPSQPELLNCPARDDRLAELCLYHPVPRIQYGHSDIHDRSSPLDPYSKQSGTDVRSSLFLGVRHR